VQVVLHHLFGGADVAGDFAIGKAFPDQGRDLHFFSG